MQGLSSWFTSAAIGTLVGAGIDRAIGALQSTTPSGSALLVEQVAREQDRMQRIAVVVAGGVLALALLARLGR